MNYPMTVIKSAWRRWSKPKMVTESTPAVDGQNKLAALRDEWNATNAIFDSLAGITVPTTDRSGNPVKFVPTHFNSATGVTIPGSIERIHDIRKGPNITSCRSNHKSTAALTEIIRAVDLGYAQLPPSLLNMAREALRR